MIKADLTNVDLSLAHLRFGTDLSEARLRGARLSGALAVGACLRKADLSGADLSGRDIDAFLLKRSTDSRPLGEGELIGYAGTLSRADLTGAVLNGTLLSGASLREAWLAGADLSGAHLDGANLSRATLKPKRYYDSELPATKWPPGFDPKAAGVTLD